MSLFEGLKHNIIDEVFNEELQKEVVKALNDNINTLSMI